MLKAAKIVRHVAVHKRDADARVNGKNTVLPGEHVCGGSGVEQISEPEPADYAAPHPHGLGVSHAELLPVAEACAGVEVGETSAGDTGAMRTP